MAQYVSKDALVAEIERLRDGALIRQKNLESIGQETVLNDMLASELNRILSFINTIEVKDHYEQHVQYDSIRAGIQAHAETYSFNIESKLFNQLTKEQQELWRKEIEQACISGGDMGVELARDTRYKENSEAKEEDLLTEGKTEKELAESYINLFDKKFGNKLPNLKGKQLAEFKNLINTCEQTFYMKYFDYHATQGKLFEKLALLWAAWGKEHLRLEMKEVDLEKEIDNQIRLLGGVHTMGSGANWYKGPYSELVFFAKHFFELGLKTQKGLALEAPDGMYNG